MRSDPSGSLSVAARAAAPAVLAVMTGFLLLFPAGGWGQSLGELARREQARQKPRAKRVYTDEDFRRDRTPGPAAESAKSGEQPTPGVRLAPFVPSPEWLVERMLEMAEVNAADTVYDLGCGDGRIMIIAAEKFGADAVGVEFDETLAKEAQKRVRDRGLEEKVKVIHGDMLQTDIRQATVVTLYLLPAANEKLRPNLEKQLPPGARVVAHDYPVPGWEAERAEKVEDDRDPGMHHMLYLYRR